MAGKKPKYSITLPNGRKIAATEYMKAIRTVRTLPDGTYIEKAGATKEQILSQYSRMMNNKINKGDKDYMKGRKWSSDYQRSAVKTAIRVNTPRLIVRETEVPKEFMSRLKNRIYTGDDF